MNSIEDDSAFVDSFFLPGGILDPDDEDVTEGPTFSNIERIPTNPWGAVTSPLRQPQHQIVLGKETTLLAKQPILVKPPPGYTEKQRVVSANEGLPLVQRNKGHVVMDQTISPLLGGNVPKNAIISKDDQNINIRKELSQKERGHSDLTLQVKPITGSQSGDDDERSERSQNNNPLSESQSKTISLEPLENQINQDDVDEASSIENSDVLQSPTNSSRSISSIPLHVSFDLPKEEIVSSVISLSTRSEDKSVYMEEEDDKTREVMPKKQVRPFYKKGQSTKKQTSPQSIPKKYSKGIQPTNTNFTHSAILGRTTMRKQQQQQQQNQSDLHIRTLLQQRLWDSLFCWFKVPVDLANKCISILQIGCTKSYHKVQFVVACVGDCINIVKSQSKQIYDFIQDSYLVLIEMFLFLISFLLAACKFALLEAYEESEVTSSYVILYFLPGFCSTLMSLMNLPHWTQHLILFITTFSMCKEIDSGLFYSGDITTTKLIHTIVSEWKGNKGYNSILSANMHPGEAMPEIKWACQKVLKSLRLLSPVLFLVAGFSSESFAIVGDTGAARLVTSFGLILIRKSLAASPIAMLSWAIQVLVTVHYASWAFLDLIVLVVGLSSIRLIRYFEFRRFQRKRQKRGNYG